MSAGSDRGQAPAWDELPAEKRNQILELTDAVEEIKEEQTQVTRRDLLQVIGGVGIGAALGGGAAHSLSQPASAGHGGGSVGTDANPVDLFAHELEVDAISQFHSGSVWWDAETSISQYSDTAGARVAYTATRARGTVDSPAAVQDGDLLGSLYTKAYKSSTDSQAAGAFDFYVDGTVTSDGIPAAAVLKLGDNGTVGMSNRPAMRWNNDLSVDVPNGGLTAQSLDGGEIQVDSTSALIGIAASGQVSLSSGSAVVDTGLSDVDATFYLALGVDDPNADCKLAGRLFWDDSAGTYKVEIVEDGTSVGNPTANYDVLRVR